MRRSWTRVFAAALVAAAVAVPVHATDQWSSGLGLCIQPSGGLSAGDGEVIVQVDRGTCINSTDASLLWNIQQAGEGYYRFINAGTGRCIDLTDGNSADGTPLQQWTCNGSDTMLWYFDSGHVVKNKHSNKCMDVRAGSEAPGAVIQNYHCASTTFGHPNLAQQWQTGPR